LTVDGLRIYRQASLVGALVEEADVGRSSIWMVAAVVAAMLAPSTIATAGEHHRDAPARRTLAAFTHPGVLVTGAQLDRVRQKIADGAQPWRSAYAQLRASRYASLDWQPRPWVEVECGSSSHPDNGCSDERQDALAAYSDALIWYLSRDPRYAAKAIEILDAWPPVIERHTNSNMMLQTGWAGAGFSRAAELLRHSEAGWPDADVARFATMLRTVYLPLLVNGAPIYNGNWELIMIDAMIGIAVFLDDQDTFAAALDMWRERVPAYLYLTTDGPLPVPPPRANLTTRDRLITYWQGQTTFVDGLSQETCRDFGHTGWGIGAAVQVAETARIQGVDLYGEQRDRLAAALEFHARYDLGAATPPWLCGGVLHRGLGPTLEVAYNEFHNRRGMAMPDLGRLVNLRRPEGTDEHFVAWETLTSAESP
jgi:hypothetical protein